MTQPANMNNVISFPASFLMMQVAAFLMIRMDAWAKIESQRLWYLAKEQPKMRADRYRAGMLQVPHSFVQQHEPRGYVHCH